MEEPKNGMENSGLTFSILLDFSLRFLALLLWEYNVDWIVLSIGENLNLTSVPF